jgi:hypothetical protein
MADDPKLVPLTPIEGKRLIPITPIETSRLIPITPIDTSRLVPMEPIDTSRLIPMEPIDTSRLIPMEPIDTTRLKPLRPIADGIYCADAAEGPALDFWRPDGEPTEAGLAQLRAAVKQALRTVSCLESEHPDKSGRKRRSVVLNLRGVPSPPTKDAGRAVFKLVKEFIMNDVEVATAFRDHLREAAARNISDFEAGSALTRVPNVEGAPGVMDTTPVPAFRRTRPTMFDLDRSARPVETWDPCHPYWYLGFWDYDSRVKIWVSRHELPIEPGPRELFGGGPAQGQGGIGPAPPPPPAPEPELLGWAYLRFGPSDTGPFLSIPLHEGPNIVRVADYYGASADLPEELDSPIYEPFQWAFWETGGYVGWLIVWHADQWFGQYHGDHCWVNADLFGRLSIRFQAVHSLRVERVLVRLNDMIIADVDYMPDIIVHAGQTETLDLDDSISLHRRESLLYPRDKDSEKYDWHAILNNPVLIQASKDLGQAWSGKYCPWDKDDMYDDPEPRLWCSEFAHWVIQNSTDISIAPSRSFLTVAAIASVFRQLDRFIYPGSTQYHRLGQSVKPGFYMATKAGNHSTFFIYWLKPDPRTPKVHTDVESWIGSIRQGPLRLEGVPFLGHFDSTRDINWCWTISGNWGDKVSLDWCAVARAQDITWVATARDRIPSDMVVYWRLDCPPWFLDPFTYSDGFGDTR